MNEIEKIKNLTNNEKAQKLLKIISLKKKIDEEYLSLREELEKSMRELGVTQLKTKDYTLTMAERKTLKITNDDDLIKKLQDRGLVVKTRTIIDDSMIPTVREILKTEEIPGAEMQKTEYISIRPNKEILWK